MPAASKKPGSTSARAAVKVAWSAGGSKPSTLKPLELGGAERVQVQVADGADRLDAGQRPEAVEQAPGVDARLVGREPGGRRHEGQDGGRLASEARVDRPRLLEAAQEEAGPDEQHQQDRELRDDQHVAPPELAGLPPPAPSLRRAPAMSRRVLCSAGTRPSKAPATTETPGVNARTRPSRRRSSVTGTGSGRSTAASRPSSQTVRPMPAPPASRLSSVVSVRTRRTSDPREAPRGTRTATSLRRWRARASRKPARLVQASSSTSPTTTISSHESGAADYIVKPFSATELVARIRAALRRREEPAPFVVGELAIDYDRRRVTLRGNAVDLTATEYELLRLFSLDAGRVVTFDTLPRRLWAKREKPHANLVRLFDRSLRRTLGDDAASPTHVFNQRGVGYRMAEPPGG